MQITGNQIGVTQIVRNDTKGAAAVNQTKPLTDKVIDLSQGDDTTIQSELNTTDATFLKVKSGSEDVYLDLSKLSSTEKKALVTTLKDQIMAYGAVKNAFDPATFFKLQSNGTLRMGNTANNKDPLYKADVMNGQKVLDKSLGKKDDGSYSYTDQTFLFMNGTSNQLSVSDSKPGEWYNGFQVKKNDQGTYEVTTYQSSLDKSGRTPPQLNIAQYKDMVKKDFNFNGAVGDLRKAAYTELGFTLDSKKGWVDKAGKNPSTEMQTKAKALVEQKFLDSVYRQFDPSHPTLSKDELTQIAKEIWSYATTGADTKGEVNIPQMQGMLKLLDPEMVKTGSNNGMQASSMKSEAEYNKLSSTEKAKYFQVGDRFAPLGDEFHGRSTILQTRHLMESFRPDAPVVLDVKTPPSELQGYANTVLLTDISSSMNEEMGFFSKIIEAGGLDGTMQMGTFVDRELDVEWSDKSGKTSSAPVTMKTSDGQKILDTQSTLTHDIQSLNSQIGTLKTEAQQLRKNGDETGAKAKETEAANKQKEVDALKLKQGTAYTTDSKNMRESGILGALGALESKPDKVGTGANTNQLVIFTDEQDAAGTNKAESLAKLNELIALAKEKGYDIKIIIASSDSKSFQIVDLSKVTPEHLKDPNIAHDPTVQLKGTKNEYVDQGGIDWHLLATKQSAKTYKWSETG